MGVNEISKEEKILTIVIPTYNMEKYLPMCLDSVTHSEVSSKLEVWIVNDGSTDHSLSIAQSYAKKRPDIIRILDKENGNYGSCVNAGLKKATGKYFRILDADDYFNTGDLIQLLKELENYDTDLVITKVKDVYYKNDMIEDEYIHDFKGPKNTIFLNSQIHVTDFAPDGEFRMHSMTYKTQVLKDCKLYLLEGISYTDTIYFLQPFAYVKDFVLLDLCLYNYRIGREGQTMERASYIKKITDLSLVFARIFQIMDETPQIEPLKSNQKALIHNGLGFLIGVLKEQHGIKEKDYESLHTIILGIKKYGFKYKLMRKWYFRLWKSTESSSVLNKSLAFRHFYKRR